MRDEPLAGRRVTASYRWYDLSCQWRLMLAKRLLDKLDHEEAKRPKQVVPRPPKGAAFLLRLLLASNDRQAIPGDLEEEYLTDILPRFGPRRAQLWFWTQTISTIAMRNPVCRWL